MMEDGSLSDTTTLAWRGLCCSADNLVTCCLTSASSPSFAVYHASGIGLVTLAPALLVRITKQGLPQPAVNWLLEAVGWRHMQITGGGAEHGECAYPLRHRRHVRRAVRGQPELGGSG